MEQIDQLEVLVSDLLDATRLQNGHLALQCTQIDLAQLCLHCAENMQHQVDRQQAGSYTIRCDIAAHLPACWANTARVQQVLTNLLENAVKYSPDGGVIEIVVGYQTHLSVTVRDHGVGIPSWQQPDLFKPFARLAHPLTRDVPGSGLGLYITRKLIEAMGGQIRLESSEGHGTCVTFTLPAVEANAPIPVHEVRQKTL
jgi:signal transduction histidine kinase